MLSTLIYLGLIGGLSDGPYGGLLGGPGGIGGLIGGRGFCNNSLKSKIHIKSCNPEFCLSPLSSLTFFSF